MTEIAVEAQETSGARYHFEEIDVDSESVHASVVKLVGASRRVLELGPATGYMSRAFTERDCAVVGIEFDPAMAERAAESCERVIVGDLDTLDLEAELGEDRFDAIVAADVIEHLKDPLGALRRLRPFLRPGGCVVISVPNVAHGSVRLALLNGHFDYQEKGLLDATHLHFFTRETLEKTLEKAELGLVEFHRYELALGDSEVSFPETSSTEELRERLERDPDARTYQFVVKAVPMELQGFDGVQRPLRELAEARGRIRQLASDLDVAEDRASKYEDDIEILRGEIENLRAENLRLKVRLERILASPPRRFYATLRTLPGLRRVGKRREAAFEAEFEQRSSGRETPGSDS